MIIPFDGVQHDLTPEVVAWARQLIADAKRDLGDDLRGYSALDLILDNSSLFTREARKLLELVSDA